MGREDPANIDMPGIEEPSSEAIDDDIAEMAFRQATVDAELG